MKLQKINVEADSSNITLYQIVMLPQTSLQENKLKFYCTFQYVNKK
jgi:hypothetical protein